MTQIRTFQYVTFARIRDFLALGWMVVMPNAAMHHHAYGVLMEKRCVCGKMGTPR